MSQIDSRANTAWPKWESPEFFAQDLDAIVEQTTLQRNEAPVLWYEPKGSWILANGGFWVFSKWEDQRLVESSPDFTTRYGAMLGDASDPSRIMEQLPQWARDEYEAPGLTPGEKRGIVLHGKISIGQRKGTEHTFHPLDPPEHTAVRGLLMKALRPSRIRRLSGFVADMADERLDQIPDDSSVDIVSLLARPMAAGLMCKMVGVPRDMWDSFADWADVVLTLMAAIPDLGVDEIARLRTSEEQFCEYIETLVAQRRDEADPVDPEDLFGVLAKAELNGQPIETAEMIRQVSAMIVGGSHTVANLIAFVLYALAIRPDQLALVRDNPELIGNAVEETLRYYPIVWTGFRTALRDVEIRGSLIHEGDYVMSSYLSANRDEDVWDRPNEFDVARSFNAGHLAFGTGTHSCPGALTARIEVTTMLQQVLRRYKSWTVVGEPHWHPTQFVNGVHSMTVSFQR